MRNRVRELRLKAGLSMSELARRCGTDAINIKNTIRRPTLT
jgi:transcriptional regulator with XRE-family HTH domain